MIQLLIDNPLLLLFLIAAVSYPLGRIKIKGSSLGVAAVLFVGLGFGALHPDLKLPEVIFMFGAVLFVYTLGLSSGPSFVASFRSKGGRDLALVVGVLLLAAALAALSHFLLGLRPALTAGMFSGSLTSTPALAGVLEYIKNNVPPDAQTALLAEPVVGYSIVYPMGVIAMIVSILVAQRLWRVDYAAEATALQKLGAANRRLFNRTIEVTRTCDGTSVGQLIRTHGWDVTFGRMRRAGQLCLITGDTCFDPGDLVSVIGGAEDVDEVTDYLGEDSQERLELDRTEFDYRRIFVSSPVVAGHRLADLNLPQQYGAIATRVRRGDVEMLAHGDTVVELGDRVRVVARRDNMEAVARFFGDSYRALSEIDVLTFSLGVTLGLLVGLIPIPLPGGLVFKLGFAGGPLVVALALGALGRTGPIVWSMPYSANLTLRQIGLIMFLAGIGSRAGYAFLTTFTQGGGLLLFAAGAALTSITALVTLWVGHRVLKIPLSLLTGMLAGIQTQPAVLGFALEQTGNELPNVGYATTYPLAMIVKIVLAQVLVAGLR